MKFTTFKKRTQNKTGKTMFSRWLFFPTKTRGATSEQVRNYKRRNSDIQNVKSRTLRQIKVEIGIVDGIVDW